jgi:hypothetical protein
LTSFFSCPKAFFSYHFRNIKSKKIFFRRVRVPALPG